MKNFNGVYPVIVTPMKENYEVNYEGLKENINYFIKQKVSGLIINGSTGEFVSLTEEEKEEIIKTVVSAVNGEFPIIVGTASEYTNDAIRLTQTAEKLGADGVLVINSYYAHPTDEEVYHQFKDIADSTSLPVMIYNNPFTSGIDISQDTLIDLGNNVKNITHLKESSGSIQKLRDIHYATGDNLTLFCGSDDLAFESFVMGAKGWVSVAGNLAPNLAKQLYEKIQSKEFEEAHEIYKKLLPLLQFIEDSGKYVQIVKAGMEIKGLNGGPSRPPRRSLKEEEINKLKKIMTTLN
ncbi:4-hydroxy-tetrahydrodipicolinate synthase [Mammaliicoccus sp. JADD-157]|uniref:4-hydroxy-tetrahydrodipicolinate synthase n=1 Tax=Mammaliicoccus sp. JADD-157 TaxID=3404818 RepID=UPI003BB7E0E9